LDNDSANAPCTRTMVIVRGPAIDSTPWIS
jgi:hypothetical protein